MAKTKRTISMTLDQNLVSKVDMICHETERQRSWFISKAIENFLEELEDIEIAHKRLQSNESVLSEKQLRKKLGI